MNPVVSLPILLPLLGAAPALLAQPHPSLQRILSTTVLGGLVVVSGALVVVVDRTGVAAVHVGGWPAPIGITLVADRLSALLLLVSSVVLLMILLYAIGQGTSGQSEAEPTVFHPVYLILAAGVAMAFLSGDLFNLFVGFEVMLAASYVLLTLAPTQPRVRAGMTYTVVSLSSSILFLTTVAVVYAATGTVNLADLSSRLPELPAGLHTSLGLLLFIVFGVKAAVVPLHLWLPDSYPTALTKITAVLAALLTKVAIYGLIRTQTLLFPREAESALLLGFALATMIVGILGALVQDDIHRLLSFALVSGIGYMVFGLALFSVAGLTATILYLVHHIVVLAALFLASDIVQRQTGEIFLHRLGGVAHTSVFAAAVFFVPALSLSGIPPLSGFIAKLALLQAGIGSRAVVAYVVTAGAVLTSLLTLVAMSRLWSAAFWGQPRTRTDHSATKRHPGMWLMDLTTVCMVVAGVTVAVLAGPLSHWGERAATDLVERTPYRMAVMEVDKP